MSKAAEPPFDCSKQNITNLIYFLSRSSDPESLKYIEVFRSVYGGFWNRTPLSPRKTERIPQWHGFEVEVISFLWLADDRFRIFSDDEKAALESSYMFSKYFSFGGLMGAYLGLCKGAFEYLTKKPFESEYEWWEKILEEQLNRGVRDAILPPPKKKSVLLGEKHKMTEIEKLECEVETKDCHRVCQLISLSQQIIQQQEGECKREFRRDYWNKYVNARKSHRKAISSKSFHPCGIVGDFFRIRKSGNENYLTIQSSSGGVKSGRGRKKSK